MIEPDIQNKQSLNFSAIYDFYIYIRSWTPVCTIGGGRLKFLAKKSAKYIMYAVFEYFCWCIREVFL